MKRIVLLCLALLMIQGVCWAKIEKGSDSFEGDYWYYVHHSTGDSEINYLSSTFTVFFTSDGNYDGKEFEISFTKDNGYAIYDTIKMQIDDSIYTWQTQTDSIRSALIRRSFPIPYNVYEALMTTQKNIAVRFYYKTISGDYNKDYVIPYKKIKEAQTMFTNYVPKIEPPAQPAK